MFSLVRNMAVVNEGIHHVLQCIIFVAVSVDSLYHDLLCSPF